MSKQKQIEAANKITEILEEKNLSLEESVDTMLFLSVAAISTMMGEKLGKEFAEAYFKYRVENAMAIFKEIPNLSELIKEGVN